MTTGTNCVQILGEQIENLTLEIGGDVEETGVNLVVPSAIDEIGLAWLDKPTKREDIGSILGLLYPDHPTYFISSQDSVWEYNPSNQGWPSIRFPFCKSI